MEHEESQQQEIEALSAIFQEHEFEVLESAYPNIEIQFTLSSNQTNSTTEDDFTLNLIVALPKEYPDCVPFLKFTEWEEDFDENTTADLIEKLQVVSSENLGMPMVFTIISALQEEIGRLVEEKVRARDRVNELALKNKEEIEQKRFHGTPVTMETFKKWKDEFDKERLAAKEKAQKEREAQLAGRLTGRQQFLRDATLNLSDAALIEQIVDIDESLFDDEELDGLDLEDSDEDK